MVQLTGVIRKLVKAAAIVAAAVSLGAVSALAASSGSSFDDRFVGLQIIDGDSFVSADGQTIRIENIDTPSVKQPRCPGERDLATKTMARLTELLQACPPTIDRRFHDDLGRLNARVSVCGEDLGTKLIDEGLASLRDVAVNWCKGAAITLIDGDSFIDNEGDTIRVENIDTPSIHNPKCAAEKELGDKTVTRVAELFQACPPAIEGSSRDKVGRLNARVAICGEDLGDKLIGEGLAIQRDSKSAWCD